VNGRAPLMQVCRRWFVGLGLAAAAVAPVRAAPATIFEITAFANPPWSMTYFDGFSGTVGVTPVWPAEMGWQGDRIDIAFDLPAGTPSNALHYRFRMVVPYQFTQSFDVTVSAGPSLADLQPAATEFVDSARVLAATIPLSRFTPGQTNYLRIQGDGVQVGDGQPPGIRWTRWSLTRTDLPSGFASAEALRLNQVQRCATYILDALQSNGLVRDGLPFSPSGTPFHPATPDAAGFALLGLCAADQLGLMQFADVAAEEILSAYAGHTPGVTPARNALGHWRHWLDVNTGGPAAGWPTEYTTIGSALLVGGALFAKNHFIENTTVGALADELYATCDFDAMIHPSLDGRVYVATDVNGNSLGTLVPWNEYMIVVSLSLRQPGATRAPAMAWRWLDPASLPVIFFQDIPTLTDNPILYAPAFWVQQMHFFNADFASNAAFETYFRNHQQADELYCAWVLGQSYRYGLTAGVDPAGYFADRIGSHHSVVSPEAVAAWAELDTVMEFAQDQPPNADSRYRYGLTRVSISNPSWVPPDSALVDHLFLMFGLVESLDPVFFKQRQPFQPDADADGIADTYDNCPEAFNPRQEDGDGDGVGDACECGTAAGDVDGDGQVSLSDLALLLAAFGRCAGDAGFNACADFDASGCVDLSDLSILLANYGT